MKKKGFTLVELLAVIAILAILVIIALPNVMSLFNEAKKNSFANELKEIYKTAQNQWMTDSLVNTQEKHYSRTGATAVKCDGTNNNPELQLSGRTELYYGITVAKSGEVTDFVATDGTYMYQYQAESNTAGLKIEDLGTSKVESVTSANAIVRLSDYDKDGATIACTSGNFTITVTE